MLKQVFKTLIAASIAAMAFGPTASAGAQTLKSTFISIGDETSVPYGWVDFCERYKDQCPEDDLAPQIIEANAANMKLINRINHLVNVSVEPVSDMDHWKLVDQWDLPLDGRGDCEDYALMKRKLLMDAGLPRQALLMTVVRDEHNEGHAILTVKTNAGEFILDNMNNEVKPWTSSGYRFVKRQSEINPNVWNSIGDPNNPPTVASNR